MHDAANILDVKMPGTKENIFPWLEIVVNGAKTRFFPMTFEPRFLPVIRQVLVGEGELVQAGQPILELEENEYSTISVGHLVAPASGIVRKWHIREGAWEKNVYIGNQQHWPNYGDTLLTLEATRPQELGPNETSARLVKQLIAAGAKAKWLNMLGAIVSIIVVILASTFAITGLAMSLASGWRFLLFVPLTLVVIGIMALIVATFVRKFRKSWRFIPSTAFGVRGS